MDKYELTEEEDLQLRFSIMLPGRRRSLYQYLCLLPMEQLRAYPKKGYRLWMGRAARSPQALALRDYVLYWRLKELELGALYSYQYLETLSVDSLRLFLNTCLRKTPCWAYEGPIQDALRLLSLKDSCP